MPISSFFFFRMYFLASGTCLFHLFFSFRMYSLASGTYLIHNFPLSRMYFIHYCSYPFYACIISTNQPQKNNVIIQIIEINILKYPTQSCVIKWLKEKLMFELIFWIIVLSYCSRLLFWVTVLNYRSELLFWVTVLNYRSELPFWVTVLSYCSELLFWITVLSYYSELLFSVTILSYCLKKLGKYKYFPRIKAIYYLSKITRWW